MTDAHLEIAYWSVVKELEPAADISVARLQAALPKFLATTGAPAKAGNVIYECLLGMAWYWPAWNDFAKKVGYETLEAIAASTSKMSAAELLKSLSVDELKQVCHDLNATYSPRAKKDELLATARKAGADGAMYNTVQSIRQRIQDSQSDRCRKQMALHMASRILSVAYSAHRYEQLSDPQLLSLRPFWRFVWGGVTDIDAPRACRKFDGKSLPYYEAQQRFPALPCSYLRCGCRVSADREDH